jgi:cell division topological specificity factor
MSFLGGLFARKHSAPVARERLQVLLAHERSEMGRSSLITVLREEILAVIAKHVTVDRDKIRVKMDRSGSVSTMEVDIEIRAPAGAGEKAPVGAAAAAV